MPITGCHSGPPIPRQQQQTHQNSHHISPGANADNPPSPPKNGFRHPKITEIRKSSHPSPGVQLRGRNRQIRTTVPPLRLVEVRITGAAPAGVARAGVDRAAQLVWLPSSFREMPQDGMFETESEYLERLRLLTPGEEPQVLSHSCQAPRIAPRVERRGSGDEA